ncbi:hypothetical protein HN51_054984, partial [Arachis hypogaea]
MVEPCLALMFCPPAGMNFIGSESDENAREDRQALYTLRPGQQVINLVCTMLTHDNNVPKWFLPTLLLR